MSKWFLHNDCLYNLDSFKQIYSGAEYAILLSNFSHNLEWATEDKFCVLKFDSEVERDLAFEEITIKLLEL